jgi:hypothetical protein
MTLAVSAVICRRIVPNPVVGHLDCVQVLSILSSHNASFHVQDGTSANQLLHACAGGTQCLVGNCVLWQSKDRVSQGSTQLQKWTPFPNSQQLALLEIQYGV